MNRKPEETHHRRSIRLRGYDYSCAGAYFVTICAQNRECLFGKIVDGKMRVNDAGRILGTVWEALSDHYPHVTLDAWIIMPNHVHGIIMLDSVGANSVGAGFVRAGLKPALTPSQTRCHGLPEIVRALKSFSSRRINEWHRTPGRKLWQRNYWEHIVRNESELNRIREYIQNNPAQWELDKLHPDNSSWNVVRAGSVGAGFKPAPTSKIRELSVLYGRGAPRPNGDEGWMV